jgi:para-nitrobenzyl esterase
MKRTTRYLVLALLVVSASIVLAHRVPETDEDDLATVVTTTGTFTGVPSPTDARTKMFLGIRYAAPPVGALRWAPPQAPTPPAGTVVASTPGNGCPQSDSSAPMQSEDCLFLNVYVPASVHPHSKLPVYYFIHGGTFTVGEGIWYDPSVLVAEHDIIVVTINYRLGALGWLAEPGLVATAANSFQNVGDSGDYGLMDQEFGLQWVQANIESFGGDPRKVTVGGHSAGGISVTNLLTSIDTAAGLFRAAIIESGWFLGGLGQPQAAYTKSVGARFEATLGCTPPTDAACLRSQSVENILNAQNNGRGVGIVVGTRMVPQDVSTALSTGQFIQVPILHGSTANEERFQEPTAFPFFANHAIVAAAGGAANYALSHPNPLCGTPAACTYLQEINLAADYLGIPTPINTVSFDTLIATEYPLANFPDPYLANDAPSADEALSQIATDLVVSCGTFDFSSQLAPWVPVFSYEFNDPAAPPFTSFIIKPPNDSYGFPTASEHGAEIQFLFTNWSTGRPLGAAPPLNAGEQQLAAQMKAYWANFVTSGDPNIGRRDRDLDFGGDERFHTHWHPFNIRQAVQDLVPGPAVPHPFYTFPMEHLCSTWEPFLSTQ